jgi:transcriptional/translational regulatory protein YebC/TACO1
VFTKHNGSLGEPGSVGYLFSQKGMIHARGSEDDVMLTALEAGAEDVRDAGDGGFEVVTAPGEMREVRAQMESAGIQVESADVTQLPSTTIPVEENKAKKVLRLIDDLDDLDDVQEVYSNYDIDDSVMEKVLAEA